MMTIGKRAFQRNLEVHHSITKVSVFIYFNIILKDHYPRESKQTSSISEGCFSFLSFFFLFFFVLFFCVSEEGGFFTHLLVHLQ